VPPTFTGQESAAEVLQVVLDQVSATLRADAVILYESGTPYLRFDASIKRDLGEFTCLYRLDRMLLNIFPDCERICDEAAEQGLLGESILDRAITVRHLAFYAMGTMLTRLMLLQAMMFQENLDDARFLTSCCLLHAIATAYQSAGDEAVPRATNEGIRTLLTKAVEATTKRRRDVLVQMLNALPHIHIPTGGGRPKGTKKSKDQKEQEAKEFERKVEETIRRLLVAGGKMPTKTAVAKALGMGGINEKGNDSSRNSFGNKLRALGINYPGIIRRVKTT
jgi:hypothetical protein